MKRLSRDFCLTVPCRKSTINFSLNVLNASAFQRREIQFLVLEALEKLDNIQKRKGEETNVSEIERHNRGPLRSTNRRRFHDTEQKTLVHCM